MKNLNSPHRTAIKRNKLSAPTRYLESEDLITGRVLDYGCGYAGDAKEMGFEVYDPYFFPQMPSGKFDTIICNYVLNVVSPEVEAGIIADIESRLTPDGVAYLCVRRDLNGDEPTQRVVILDLPIVEENSGFCIYETCA